VEMGLLLIPDRDEAVEKTVQKLLDAKKMNEG